MRRAQVWPADRYTKKAFMKCDCVGSEAAAEMQMQGSTWRAHLVTAAVQRLAAQQGCQQQNSMNNSAASMLHKQLIYQRTWTLSADATRAMHLLYPYSSCKQATSISPATHAAHGHKVVQAYFWVLRVNRRVSSCGIVLEAAGVKRRWVAAANSEAGEWLVARQRRCVTTRISKLQRQWEQQRRSANKVGCGRERAACLAEMMCHRRCRQTAEEVESSSECQQSTQRNCCRGTAVRICHRSCRQTAEEVKEQQHRSAAAHSASRTGTHGRGKWLVTQK
jgi:hypothetical protein